MGIVDGEFLFMSRKPAAAELALGWSPLPHQARVRELRAGASPVSILSPDCDYEFATGQPLACEAVERPQTLPADTSPKHATSICRMGIKFGRVPAFSFVCPHPLYASRGLPSMFWV